MLHAAVVAAAVVVGPAVAAAAAAAAAAAVAVAVAVSPGYGRLKLGRHVSCAVRRPSSSRVCHVWLTCLSRHGSCTNLNVK